MRRTVVRALLLGAAAGLVLGSLARALMRLVAIGMAAEPEFHLGASIAIVSLFVISAAGACVVRAVDLRGWRATLAILGSSAPLLLMGTAFAIGEIQEVIDRDLTLPWTIELLCMAGVIVMAVLVTPYAGWRAGGAARGRARRQVAERSVAHH